MLLGRPTFNFWLKAYTESSARQKHNYDLNAVAVYKESPKEGNLDLAGYILYVPIELSRVLAGFCFAVHSHFATPLGMKM